MLKRSSSKNPKPLPLEFDHQSTTPCEREIIEAMAPYWNEDYGNPSNRNNRAGLHAAAAISLAREQLAASLNVSPERLIFTSGATEANNLALLGYARAKAAQKGSPGHLITLETEHLAVLDPVRQLKNEGFRVTELRPENNGLLNPSRLEEAIKKDTFLVSIMIANNEIGVIQPLQEISKICKEKGVALHSDAAQAFGHIPLEPDILGIDLMSISAHKCYGPKGIGALLLNPELPIFPIQWGGGQEQGLRPGTLAVPLIIGLAKAAEIAMKDLTSRQMKIQKLRDKLWMDLKTKIPNLTLNGSLEKRLPHNLNFTVAEVVGNKLHRELRSLITCSNGSACSRGRPSHVLMAIGRSRLEAEASLRLGLGRHTTVNDVNEAVQRIARTIHTIRGL